MALHFAHLNAFRWWQCSDRYIISRFPHLILQELCESRGGRPGLSVLTSLLVSVDVKLYWTMLRHWSQLVPNMSTDSKQHYLPTYHLHPPFPASSRPLISLVVSVDVKHHVYLFTCTGAAPAVAVRADAGVTAPAAVAAWWFWLVECCFTSTEIVGLLGHLDFHTSLGLFYISTTWLGFCKEWGKRR